MRDSGFARRALEIFRTYYLLACKRERDQSMLHAISKIELWGENQFFLLPFAFSFSFLQASRANKHLTIHPHHIHGKSFRALLRRPPRIGKYVIILRRYVRIYIYNLRVIMETLICHMPLQLPLIGTDSCRLMPTQEFARAGASSIFSNWLVPREITSALTTGWY